MTYPGNPSLSADAQQRILGTFEQTLDLAAQGSRQEALLGCDFVLRMDPQFEPARRLLDRLKSTAGAVAVGEFQMAAPAAGDARDPLFSGAGDLHDLPDLPDLSSEFPELPPEPAAPGATSDGGDLHARLLALLTARRFQDVMTLVESESAAVMADPELGKLAQTAYERSEAEPYVTKFLGKVRETIAAGQLAEAGKLLAKARALDATHPGIADLAGLLARQAAAPAPEAPPAPAVPRASRELPPPLRPAAAPPIDLLQPASAGDSESERRISQLLDDGQAALDGGDPQAAIDAWSRIFLIDIDHQEAARRIEQARKLKAENERQVEEIFHDGMNSLDGGDPAAARRAFERVLELQPSYLAAREYLQQIDSGNLPLPSGSPGGASGSSSVEAAAVPRPTGREAAAAPAAAAPPLESGAAELTEEILVPPDPGEAPVRSGRRERRERGEPQTAARAGGASRRFLYIGGAVLAIVLLTGAVLYLKWDSLFHNLPAEDLPTTPPARNPNPITRAQNLQKQGKTTIAVAQLRRLPPTDPHYQEAQALIAQWEAPAAPAAPRPGPALAPDVSSRRQQLLDAGRRAYLGRDYLRASDQLGQAAAIAKLDAGDADELVQAKRQLEPLAQQVELFKQHEWEYILPALWRLRESDPQNRDVKRLIVDSYYNLGVRDLQRADPIQAAGKFEEALKLDPDDAVLRRHYLFAQTYQQRPKDLLFRIYVKYLALR